jgi:hypothetical protein
VNDTLRPAALDEGALAAVTALEEQTGSTVVAYEPESAFAPLSDEQVTALQRAESRLGVRLLAYRR